MAVLSSALPNDLDPHLPPVCLGAIRCPLPRPPVCAFTAVRCRGLFFAFHEILISETLLSAAGHASLSLSALN